MRKVLYLRSAFTNFNTPRNRLARKPRHRSRPEIDPLASGKRVEERLVYTGATPGTDQGGRATC
jgi:hypothetical protein